MEKKRVNKSMLISEDLHKMLDKKRAALGLRNFPELFRYFLVTTNDTIKKD